MFLRVVNYMEQKHRCFCASSTTWSKNIYVTARRQLHGAKTSMCWIVVNYMEQKHLCVGSPSTTWSKNIYVLARRRFSLRNKIKKIREIRVIRV
jgi:hypothetical protein